MALLRLNGQLSSSETHDAEGLLEGNALLGDYSSDEYDNDLGSNNRDQQTLLSNGAGQDEEARTGLRRSASRNGHVHQETV